jgi:hypothetical protein
MNSFSLQRALSFSETRADEHGLIERERDEEGSSQATTETKTETETETSNSEKREETTRGDGAREGGGDGGVGGVGVVIVGVVRWWAPRSEFVGQEK